MRLRRPPALALSLLLGVGCIPNNPYPPGEAAANYLYSSYGEPPKHLDPAVAYSVNEYVFIQQIYEPPLQYHYLKRPYELVPLTAAAVPEPAYFDSAGQALGADPPPEAVARAVYTVRLRPGIHYQSHPCFATAGRDGEAAAFVYHDLSGPDGGRSLAALERDLAEHGGELEALPHTGSRELTAADYVYQIKRLAHPGVNCPIYSSMAGYIVGLSALREALAAELDRARSERRRAAGALYNQETDERGRPLWLDLDRFDLAGARVVDRYTFQIELSRKYPQFAYWLAMPFFAPVPREADRLFAQPPMVRANLDFDNRAVGTGPFRLQRFVPQEEIVLVRNEAFHDETYPAAGDPGDAEAGLLADAGRRLPFIDRAVYKLEKESIPHWSKFLQGYYETAGIVTEVFDQAIEMNAGGGLELSGELAARGIRLSKSVEPTTHYLAFNMLDDIVGGYSESSQKLRQAIAIAVDIEEWVQIFANGRGLPAQDPLPPGIFGHRSGREGVNPHVYRWDEARGEPRRRSLAEARQLMAEAGYPGGQTPAGTPLTVYFDTFWSGAGAKARGDWVAKQFAKLGIDLQVRQTDYNRFRDKVNGGNFQVIFWGWHADYPDPENFLFMLYGPNGTARYGGANHGNYANPEFDRLFRQVESMPNGPQRLALIEGMVDIARRDSPWIWGYHPVGFGLHHEWYGNFKEMSISYNNLKFRRLDARLREEKRHQWNDPVWWPLGAVALAVGACVVPAAMAYRRREREVRA